jgi:hypothetical protein
MQAIWDVMLCCWVRKLDSSEIPMPEPQILHYAQFVILTLKAAIPIHYVCCKFLIQQKQSVAFLPNAAL